MVIRRKPNFLPTVFVSAEFDNVFIPRVARCFETLITTAHHAGDESWHVLMATLDQHGLCELTVPNEMVLGLLEFQITGRDGQTTTRTYESTEPYSYGFDKMRIEIDRASVESDVRLREASSILAFLFCWMLFSTPMQAQDFALVRLDSASLSDYLRSHHRGEVSPAALSTFILARTIDDLIANSPAFAEFDRVSERIAACSSDKT